MVRRHLAAAMCGSAGMFPTSTEIELAKAAGMGFTGQGAVEKAMSSPNWKLIKVNR